MDTIRTYREDGVLYAFPGKCKICGVDGVEVVVAHGAHLRCLITSPTMQPAQQEFYRYKASRRV